MVVSCAGKQEKPKKAEKAIEAPKPKQAGFVGKVDSIDGKTMMVKSKKEAIGFDVSKVPFKGYKAIGDVKVATPLQPNTAKKVEDNEG